MIDSKFKNTLKERLMQANPCKDLEIQEKIRNNRVAILSGDYDGSEEILQHRQNCMVCADILAQEYQRQKNDISKLVSLNLEANQGSGMIERSSLGYAAGSSDALRSLSEQSLREAGLGTGFYIEVSESQGGEYAIKVISEVPKRFLLSFLNKDDEVLFEIEVSNFPVYLSEEQIREHCRYCLIELH